MPLHPVCFFSGVLCLCQEVEVDVEAGAQDADAMQVMGCDV